MKKRILNVLFELIRNSKKSDRDIAKKLNISQPTVTRIRKKLETSGYITEYTVIPNFPKLGFEIIAFIFFSVDRAKNAKLKCEAHKWINQNPNVIFAADGDGIQGKNCMMATVHKNFTDYNKFVNEFKLAYGVNIKNLEAFLVPLASSTPKYISFKSITDLIKHD